MGARTAATCRSCRQSHQSKQLKSPSDATRESEIIMTHLFTMKQLCLAISCALALGVTAGPARAQAARTQVNPDAGYLTGNSGSVTRSAYGLCWYAGSQPDPQSINQCAPIVVPAPIAMAVEPEPKAAEPVASTMAAVDATPAAAPPAIERLTLDADALFDFDRSELRPAGRSALDDFAGRMKGIDPEMIMAVGYADRLGSDAYNQHLSELRAEAVKTYLVSIGIAPDRVHIEGRGESDPVTRIGECDGTRSVAVITCLQPDRRVVVEVMGNRTTR
jgi:OmpA-OmpF porin, OOP family